MNSQSYLVNSQLFGVPLFFPYKGSMRYVSNGRSGIRYSNLPVVTGIGGGAGVESSSGDVMVWSPLFGPASPGSGESTENGIRSRSIRIAESQGFRGEEYRGPPPPPDNVLINKQPDEALKENG